MFSLLFQLYMAACSLHVFHMFDNVVNAACTCTFHLGYIGYSCMICCPLNYLAYFAARMSLVEALASVKQAVTYIHVYIYTACYTNKHALCTHSQIMHSKNTHTLNHHGHSLTHNISVAALSIHLLILPQYIQAQ